MNIRAIGFLTGILMTGVVMAESSPQVEYSADSVMEHAEGSMKGKVYYTPAKERREMEAGAEKMITIIRRDKKVIWTLMPEDKIYMEMKQGGAAPAKDDLSAYQIEQTVIGPETVNGVNTTKGKIIMTGKDGSKFGGFMWTTREGIVVKMDAVSIDKDSKDRFKTELTNLKIGKQDPALFEIPRGFEKMGMDMPGMGMDMLKGMFK